MKHQKVETSKRRTGEVFSRPVTCYSLLLATCLACSSPTFAQAPTASTPASLPVASSQPALEHHPNPKIDAILTRLEQKGNTLNDLVADVIYGNEETLVGSNVVRYGNILVLRGPADAQGQRQGKFLVHFDKVIADGEAAQESEAYLFDGEFLVTRKDKTKLARKQRLTEAGQNADPFKLDGPFPVPFGARKSEMLTTFDISQTPPKEIKEPPDSQPTEDSLWLTPKPNSKLARDIRHLNILVDRATDLPLRVVSYEQQDKIKRAIFRNVKLNTGLPAGKFVLEIPSDYQFEDTSKR